MSDPEPSEKDDLVDQALNAVNRPNPPADLAESVMQRVAGVEAGLPAWRRWRRAVRAKRIANFLAHEGVGSYQTNEGRPEAVPGGVIVRTKILWGVTGVAAMAIVSIFVFGYPPIGNSGTEGSIGQAQRYQGATLSAKDISVPDTDVQQFIQSETFDRLLKDSTARAALIAMFRDENLAQALANPAIYAAVSQAGIRDLLAQPAGGLREALGQPAFQELLAQPAAREALGQAGVQEAFGQAAFQQLLAQPAFLDALARPAVQRALATANVQQLLAQPALSRYLAQPANRDALAQPAVMKALAQPAILAALGQPAAQKALAQPAILAVFAQPALANALANAQVSHALAQPAIFDALAQPAVRAGLANAALMQALAHPAMTKALGQAGNRAAIAAALPREQ